MEENMMDVCNIDHIVNEFLDFVIIDKHEVGDKDEFITLSKDIMKIIIMHLNDVHCRNLKMQQQLIYIMSSVEKL